MNEVGLSVKGLDARERSQPGCKAALLADGRLAGQDLLLVPADAYARVQVDYPPLPGLAKMREPGLVSKVGHLASAGARIGVAIARGERVAVGADVQLARLEICRQCEYYIPDGEKCRKCGCYLAGKVFAKTKYATEACPIGKWGPCQAPCKGNADALPGPFANALLSNSTPGVVGKK
jgi:hypothetical protein